MHTDTRSTIAAEATAAARALAARRERITLQCEVCGTAMIGYAYKRTCSNRCRQRAAYARKRQARQGASDALSATSDRAEDNTPAET